MSAALQAYADRGVFRGFSATPGARGRIDYRFLWLTKRPLHAAFDIPRQTLTFPALFPAIDAGAARELAAAVASRTSRTLPNHKRLDARRARLASARRQGDFTLRVEIRGDNHAYAVSKSLNLVNELFLILHESHPGYLVERFGISAE